MKIFGLGMPELLIILAIVCLLFGPKYLPKLGKALGKTVSALREGLNNGKTEAQADEPEEEPEPKRRKKAVKPKAIEAPKTQETLDAAQEQANENPVVTL